MLKQSYYNNQNKTFKNIIIYVTLYVLLNDSHDTNNRFPSLFQRYNIMV
jgi:hypothetical protein